jgi:hypothetical protein
VTARIAAGEVSPTAYVCWGTGRWTRASEFARQTRAAAAPDSARPWKCASCGEELAPQFDSCWKCGASRGKPVVERNRISSDVVAGDGERHGPVEAAELVVTETNKKQSGQALVFGSLILIAGIVWAVAEQNAGWRMYIFRILPVSWFFIGCGGFCVVSGFWGAQGGDGAGGGRTFHVTEAGVQTDDGLIPWPEIHEIYHGGQIMRVNFVKSSEEVWLKVVARDGRSGRLKLSARSLDAQQQKAMGQIHRVILERVAQRQWQELLTALQAGEAVPFGPLTVRADGICWGTTGWQDQQWLPWNRIRGHALHQGGVYLSYLNDKGKEKTAQLAEVAETPNLHLFTALMDMMAAKQS